MTKTKILEQLALEFKTSRKRGSPFDGCVGALDGIAIPLEKPRDVTNLASFYNRKGFYAIPVQAVVDARCRFVSFSANWVGSTHDAVVHAEFLLKLLFKLCIRTVGFSSFCRKEQVKVSKFREEPSHKSFSTFLACLLGHSC